MPNWCENKLVITGDKKIVEEIVAKAGTHENSSVFSFSAFDPLPQHLVGTTKGSNANNNPEGYVQALKGNQHFDYDNWYDWQLAHWGTKWDCDNATLLTEAELAEGNYQVEFFYNTAWSPGVQFAITLSSQYPEVEVKNYYSESGMNFAGVAVAIGGNLIEDIYINDLTAQHYASVGAVMTADGTQVDWDVAQDFDLFDLFD